MNFFLFSYIWKYYDISSSIFESKYFQPSNIYYDAYSQRKYLEFGFYKGVGWTRDLVLTSTPKLVIFAYSFVYSTLICDYLH